MSENVNVRIKSTIINLVDAERFRVSSDGRFFTDDDGKRRPVDEIESCCSETYEYSAAGEMSEENGKIVIKYKEPDSIGYSDCTTTFILSENEKNTVTMTRSGDLGMACRFDMNEKRQICCYETPVIPLEFVVQTKKVFHSITSDGGSILLDYYIEIRGANAERSKLFIEVRKR